MVAMPVTTVPTGELVMPRSTPADRNPAAVYLAGLAPTGRAGMASRLRQVARLLGADDWPEVPWQNLRYQHVAAIRTQLQEQGLAPATVNATLAALRGVAEAAYNLELIDADTWQRIRQVKAVRGERLPAGRALSAGELAALMGACANDAGNAGVRDAAIIALLYGAGLRRAEVVALDVSDYNPETGQLRVLGKGDKERLMPITNGAADAMADWLTVRGEEPGPLFCRINKGGRVSQRGMSGQALYAMLRKRGAEAGVRPFTPHDLRHTFIGDLLDAGADIVTVQRLAGHANVQTTARYDRRPEETKRKAVNLLHVPYRRRLA